MTVNSEVTHSFFSSLVPCGQTIFSHPFPSSVRPLPAIPSGHLQIFFCCWASYSHLASNSPCFQQNSCRKVQEDWKMSPASPKVLPPKEQRRWRCFYFLCACDLGRGGVTFCLLALGVQLQCRVVMNT